MRRKERMQRAEMLLGQAAGEIARAAEHDVDDTLSDVGEQTRGLRAHVKALIETASRHEAPIENALHDADEVFAELSRTICRGAGTPENVDFQLRALTDMRSAVAQIRQDRAAFQESLPPEPVEREIVPFTLGVNVEDPKS